MPIVTSVDIAKTFQIDKYGAIGASIANKAMDWLSINKLNAIYDKYFHLSGLNFIDAVLEELHVQVLISDDDLKRLPESGPYIIVANHPLGGIDGLIMLKLLLTKHPDSKIMANFLLNKIGPLKDHICAVNPFENHKQTFHSLGGIRSAMEQLKIGLPLGIFPAGEVSSLNSGVFGIIEDKNWDQCAMKFIKKSGVKVIPMYFQARNSDLFYILSSINGMLRTAKLPSEMITKVNKNVTVRIGNPITVSRQDSYSDIQLFSDFLRQRTYLLGKLYKKPKVIHIGHFKKNKHQIETTMPIAKLALDREILKLFTADQMLFESGDYQLYFTQFEGLPGLKIEIGRLRECTFREVGEGTGLGLDTDKYDDYYHHLILWDKVNSKIAGSYRLGIGQQIINNFGIKGFYTSNLFYLSGPFKQVFSESIEVGRAFITPEYQLRPMPLFLLWKGIMDVAAKYPACKYLIGAASISNQYSYYSRSLIVEYLKMKHFDFELALYVAPKKAFHSALKKKELDMIQKLNLDDLKSIDQMIEEIELQKLKVPILIKNILAGMLSFLLLMLTHHLVML
ncbi:MAG: lysophospholipid acyltransferase family protein [Saprospiraceae bacterium]|nr:lysophospholipid acyltransferase family protein [Saprospiraceae bacterium]